MKGVKVDEMLYWKIGDNYNNNVIGFNIKDHTFHQLPFCNTNFEPYGRGMTLCNIGGSLCGWGYVYSHQLDKMFIEIWRIEYKENSGLWTIMFKFDVDGFKDYFIDIIGFTKDGKIIMQKEMFQPFVVNPNEDHTTFVYIMFGTIKATLKFNLRRGIRWHFLILPFGSAGASVSDVDKLGFPNLSLGLNEVLKRPTACKRIVSFKVSEASNIVRATTAHELSENEFPADMLNSDSICRGTLPLKESLSKVISYYGSKILLEESDRKPRISKKKGKKQLKPSLNLVKGENCVDNWQGSPPWDFLNGGDGCPKFLCDVMVS